MGGPRCGFQGSSDDLIAGLRTRCVEAMIQSRVICHAIRRSGRQLAIHSILTAASDRSRQFDYERSGIRSSGKPQNPVR